MGAQASYIDPHHNSMQHSSDGQSPVDHLQQQERRSRQRSATLTEDPYLATLPETKLVMLPDERRKACLSERRSQADQQHKSLTKQCPATLTEDHALATLPEMGLVLLPDKCQKACEAELKIP